MGKIILKVELREKEGVKLTDSARGQVIDEVEDALKELLTQLGLDDSIEIFYPSDEPV